MKTRLWHVVTPQPAAWLLLALALLQKILDDQSFSDHRVKPALGDWCNSSKKMAQPSAYAASSRLMHIYVLPN